MENNKTGGGIGFAGLLTIAFVVLSYVRWLIGLGYGCYHHYGSVHQ